jgi:hypothetical protein
MGGQHFKETGYQLLLKNTKEFLLTRNLKNETEIALGARAFL